MTARVRVDDGVSALQTNFPHVNVINDGLAVFHVPLEESFEPFPSVTAERIEPDGSFFSTDTVFNFTGDPLKCPAGLRDEIKKI